MPPTRSALVAERRVCSVLFVDLVGFTPLVEGRDAEDVRELLSEYFGVARTVISRYGGQVEKFIGDAVMAVWGAPVVREGDAERAVRAGLDLVAAVGVLGERVGVAALAARAGVVTGEVAVTLGAVGEGMVAGDPVNTAARVQAEAAPGSVWVDATSRRLAERAVSFEEAGVHALKGKSEPMRLWRAVRVVSRVGGAQRVGGLEGPLVGRDRELRLVKDLFHTSVERRVPGLVVVSGAAGAGKSRLGWEFEKYVDGLSDTVLWHRGRCLSYGDGMAFWALAEIVRQRFGIAEDESVGAAAAKLAEGLVRFVPDPAERASMAVRVGRLLGVEVEGDGGAVIGRAELFAGWRLLFERLAQVAPVVLVVEDAEHADPGLLDFLDHLVDWVRDLSVFVVVFARPDLAEGRAGFGVGRNRTALSLDPLDELSLDCLVDALVPGMPASARAKITAHARGIPLFAVETIRSLIDRDVVVVVDGVNRLVADVGALTVPESLHALLAARLDALAPGVRGLVADASVIGSTFPADALVAVSGRGGAEVRADLAELVRRDVLEVFADPQSPQRGSYRFGHEMVRQVAYNTIGRRDRKARHLAVAAHLRHAFTGDGEEVADVIAHHYLDALHSRPTDADVATIRHLAVDMLIRGADRSLRSGAPGPAAASYASAAQQTELTAHPDADRTAGWLWELAANAALTANSHDLAIAHAEAAIEHHTRHESLRGCARAQTTIGRALERLGRLNEAREQLSAALVVLRPDPDADTVYALQRLASLEHFSGSPHADRLSVEALDLGQALEVDPALMAGLFITRGLGLAFANRRAEAAIQFEKAARVAERAGDGNRQAAALLNLSDIQTLSAPISGAEAASRAADHARRVGNVNLLGLALGNQMAALLFAGDWAQAERVQRRAIDIDQIATDDFAVRSSLLAALRGNAAAAAAFAAVPMLRASEDRQDQACVEACDAFVAAVSDRPFDVLAHARNVIAHAPALGLSHEFVRWVWPLAARTAHDLGDADTVRQLLAVLGARPAGEIPPLLLAEGDLAAARHTAADGDPDAPTALAAAVERLRQAASPYHLAHGLLDLARSQSDGDPAAARCCVNEARTIAEGLACPPLLDRAAAIEQALDARSLG